MPQATPAPTSTAGTSSTPRGSGGAAGLRRYRGIAAIGGAALVVIVALARRGSGGGSGGAVEYDSTAEDLYNMIQPTMEDYGRRVGDLEGEDRPRPSEPVRVVQPVPRYSRPRPQPAPKKPAPKSRPAPRKPAPTKTYTVRKGDTLSEIGKRYGVSWRDLYRANKSGIETSAKKHGRKSSDTGHWIYAGTKLKIPGRK